MACDGRQNSYRAFSLREVQIFGRQLLRTVAFLHKMKLIHTGATVQRVPVYRLACRRVGPVRPCTCFD